MAAVCRQPECSQVDVDKWDGSIPPGEPILCGECGVEVERTDTPVPSPWEAAPDA